MKKSTLFSLITIFVLIPLTLYLGTHLKGRWHYLTSTLVIIETMLPFFFLFESRKPQARELVTIAVMCALAAASRVAFTFLPSFKPITAIVMLTGVALGAEAGFLTGAISAFASNFFFSQGPWTPWQMLAYGIGGFLAGVLFHKRPKLRDPRLLAVFGVVLVMTVIGPLLDLCTLFTTSVRFSWAAVMIILGNGLGMNIAHAVSCALTMLLFGRPLLEKLERLKHKYGMLEAGHRAIQD